MRTLCLLLLSLTAFAQTGDLGNRVTALVEANMAARKTPALSIAILKDHQIVYSRAFGTADIENNLPATSESLFRTGSIAKPLAAVAALTLADAGKLDLDAPVQQYCPDFPKKQWTITTRELLSHTAGIRHYKGEETLSTVHYPTMSAAFAIFANDPLLFEPSTQYSYSTYAYTIVGCVIEGIAHQSYYDYLAAHVLKPAGMTHTFVDDQFAIVPHRVRGYQNVKGQIRNAGPMDSSYKIPGGGLVTTAEDLVRFEDAMLGGKLIKPQTREAAWTPLPVPDASSPDKPSKYGLGWMVGTRGGHKVVGHSGSQQGCNTAMGVVPDQNFAIAILTNYEGGSPQGLVDQILEEFAGATRPKR